MVRVVGNSRDHYTRCLQHLGGVTRWDSSLTDGFVLVSIMDEKRLTWRFAVVSASSDRTLLVGELAK